MMRAADAGVYTLTLRRCQHIACLAAALVPLVERGFVGLLMASSPGEAYVSPFGGSHRLFSNNPLAFVAPTSTEPLLFDISMAITAGGRVARAAREGCALPEQALKTGDGDVSSDPSVMTSGGTVMPIGGIGHGHKGHALTLMTEVLTQALSGLGRSASPGASEENSVFLQVFDPQAFGPRADYLREVDHLVRAVTGSTPDDPDHPVRVPGQRAWRLRAEQLDPWSGTVSRYLRCAATVCAGGGYRTTPSAQFFSGVARGGWPGNARAVDWAHARATRAGRPFS